MILPQKSGSKWLCPGGATILFQFGPENRDSGGPVILSRDYIVPRVV
jgi:hypothetical protein